MAGVYLHIPYCESKCHYCDFYSLGGSQSVPDAYIKRLQEELRRFAPHAETLYFGGGTPSLLTPAQVAALIEAAAPEANAEITLEANPHLVTPQSLAAYRSAGVNRLSLGVQTAHAKSLQTLGRRHTVEQAQKALADAVKAGFTNISGDVMLALPYYTQQEMRDTVDLLTDGGCTHISSYLLKIEPNTAFGKHPPNGLPDSDTAADFYLDCVAYLAQKGYVQYEISNFARPGYEGKHNLIYWNCGDYLGLGPAAHSCMDGKRFYTAGTLQSFLQGADYVPDGTVTAEDYIMLQLRLASGLNLQKLAADWGVQFTAQQQKFCETLCKNKLATLANEILTLTPQGMLLQNSILCELL